MQTDAAGRRGSRFHLGRAVALALLIGVLGAGCSRAAPEPTESRGQVFDQDTLLPIAGAFVVGRYMGSFGAHNSPACNRIEGAITDANGWFTLPLDKGSGILLINAFAPGYTRGDGPRRALQTDPSQPSKWQVVVDKWNPETSRWEWGYTEPQVYGSEREALDASGERRNVFIKKSMAKGKARLDEIRVMRGDGLCGGPATSSVGSTAYFQGILEEQIRLGADDADQFVTRESIRRAERINAR
jgi:hypothetical protein